MKSQILGHKKDSPRQISQRTASSAGMPRGMVFFFFFCPIICDFIFFPPQYLRHILLKILGRKQKWNIISEKKMKSHILVQEEKKNQKQKGNVEIPAREKDARPEGSRFHLSSEFYALALAGRRFGFEKNNADTSSEKNQKKKNQKKGPVCCTAYYDTPRCWIARFDYCPSGRRPGI